MKTVANMLTHINGLAAEVGRSVTVVAAAKTQTAETVRAAIGAGVTDVGENRAQELLAKWREGAYEGATVHFIGHLQRNKLSDVVGKIHMLQSVDSMRLAEAADEESRRQGTILDVLIQIKMGEEETKYGFLPDEMKGVLGKLLRHKGLRIRGLMTIPPPGGDRIFFQRMYELYVDIKNEIGDNCFNTLSMGMSDDYASAIAEGSTMVRLGTALFGQRRR